MADEDGNVKKTNFDAYLDEQMKDRAFAERFERAGAAWNIALQIAALRKQAGLSQKDLARELKTSQQQISRLESPAYEGHSLSMLRRVAEALDAELKISFEPHHSVAMVAESPGKYTTGKKS
jgi:ribosome-binding protein aMBF1 (putative translation factor)